jgi:hypothetical protein
MQQHDAAAEYTMPGEGLLREFYGCSAAGLGPTDFQVASFSDGVMSLQVYLILDEFIMGGEIQETSKKV